MKWGTSIDILINGTRDSYFRGPLYGFDPAPYRNAEREAERGMWSLGDKYISPKEWRRMQREVKR